MTNKYGVAFFVLLTFSVPSISFAAPLTQTQAESLINVVQSSPGTPASAFTSFITAFSNITIAQAESLIGVVQSAPGVAASSFVNLLVSFTQEVPAAATTQLTTTTVPDPIVVQETTSSAAPTTTNQNPVASTPPVSSGSTVAALSIQSSVCNLKSSNLKAEYSLANLIESGNIDGRIFMNAYVLDSEGQNYYRTNPPVTMNITSSIQSQSKTENGSGNTGPCGYYYPYELYSTNPGTYTVTYSIPELNLEKTVTVTIN